MALIVIFYPFLRGLDEMLAVCFPARICTSQMGQYDQVDISLASVLGRLKGDLQDPMNIRTKYYRIELLLSISWDTGLGLHIAEAARSVRTGRQPEVETTTFR